jgi:putative phosphoesterase
MRVACLYDIHANLPALEAVLAEVRDAKVDRVVIGGDVLPGPMPRECLEAIFDLGVPTHCIMGNGDHETIAARHGTISSAVPALFHDAMKWDAAQLTTADEHAIEAWPLTLRLHVRGIGDVLFCHATPRNDTDIFVKTTADATLLPIFDPLSVQLVVCGHTHMQFDRTVGRTRIVNAGSVGMPFQEPAAYWVMLGPDVELRRTAYDLGAAAARVRATAYPQAEQAAAGILAPPSEQTMLEQFASAAIK